MSWHSGYAFYVRISSLLNYQSVKKLLSTSTMAFEGQEQLPQYKIRQKPIIRPLEMCESLMAWSSVMHTLSRTAQKLCHYEITSIFIQTAFLPSLIPADAPRKYWKNHGPLITRHLHGSIEWLSARFRVGLYWTACAKHRRKTVSVFDWAIICYPFATSYLGRCY